MRIVFCGSGDLGIPALGAIRRAGHEVVRVVTQPARRAGRGGKMRITPLAEEAHENGLDVLECPDINDSGPVGLLGDDKPDAMCVVDFAQMIRAAARSSAKLGAFNLYASLLPELRGAAPVNRAIIRGLPKTGVTTFELVDEMDAGPIYVREATEIRADETAEQLRKRLSQMGAGAVLQTLELLASERAKPRSQDHENATFAPRLAKSDGIIDWQTDAVTIRNLIHGTWPWPGARTTLLRLEGKSSQQGSPALVVTIAQAAARDERPGASPGLVDDDRMIAAGRGRLEILRIQPAGKRLMTWKDFLNGYRVQPGDQFIRQSRR